ncbi:lipid-A-disaccharide synthase N-terminal domain-containing protein [Oleisolibacter albus]|uniref:lipid-A-disaccharide synthase N-terminal domain-containing protein n=1 Tax=Oleisolibacter albus TaxID=2171757 RepID=UPI000DF16677|nr:lipid-A-disaccharide synthase N-terminal domain-containing protein [Oleisolibacter albus]
MHWLEIQHWLISWWQDATAHKGWLVLFGLVAQAMFMGRFVVQWLASERAKRSVVPVAFWYFSLGGGLMIFTYGVLDRDLVVMAGQMPAILIYLRNLHLIRQEKQRLGRIDIRAEAEREIVTE